MQGHSHGVRDGLGAYHVSPYRGYVHKVHDRDDSAGSGGGGVGLGPNYDKMTTGYPLEI
jgi:hypothetical protein